MKSIVNKILNRFGLKLVRISGKDRKQASSINARLNFFLKSLKADPLNPNLHLRYGIEASKCDKSYLAFAELKSAEYLGADCEQVAAYKPDFRRSLPDLLDMNHNKFFRFASLSTAIKEKAGNSDVSILDVGGGQGELASFIPEAYYCLAEPGVNGISGYNLPFTDHSFDYVVAWHVLEHIPQEDRRCFLDQLISKSKRGVILLNPFHLEFTHAEERLKLVYEITDADWAKEHLDCTLPTIQEIENYANQRKLHFSVKPNGTLTTSIAFVFLDHFALESGKTHNLKKINRLFNEKYMGILDSESYPNSYLVYIGWLDETGFAAQERGGVDPTT